MARVITDPYKLVRRAKAVVMVNGRNDYKTVPHFVDALKRMGFIKEQIESILNQES